MTGSGPPDVRPRRRPRPHPLPVAFRTLAAGVGVALLVACGSGGGAGEGRRIAPGESLEGWNVLLLTLDTTRRDRVGCYGYEAARTPNLDALAERGVRFDNAVTQCPVTLPAHTTMMTGFHPTWHGVRGNGAYRLPAEQTTLAERLSDAGYQTGAAVAAEVLDARYGLDQGFEHYDDEQGAQDSSFHYPERSADEVTDAALAIADRFDGRRPWFLWVHYFDPHGRYDPPADIARRFPDDDSGRYDGEIATMDRGIGKLLEGLGERGLRDRTLVVAIGDHGEGFPGPHEEKTHGMLVYRDTLEVPFLVAAEGRSLGGRIAAELVGTVDVAPTILDLVGAAGLENPQGRSLASLVLAEGESGDANPGEDAPAAGRDPSPASESPTWMYAETVAPWDFYGWSPLYQIRDRHHKLVWGPKPELYLLDEDPDQLDDVADRHPEIVRRLQDRIRAVHAKAHATALDANTALGGTPDVTPEQQKRLEALGYASVKGGAIPGLDERTELGDPAKLIGLSERLETARTLSSAGDAKGAIEMLEDVLEVDPDNLEALGLIGAISARAGLFAKSEDAFRELCDRRPGNRTYRGKLADAQSRYADDLAKRGNARSAEIKREQAIANFRTAIGDDPQEAGPLVNLARLLLLKRRPSEAEHLLRRAMEVDPETFEAPINLAAVLIATNRREEAARLVEKVAAAATTPEQHAAVSNLRARLRTP